jgi:polysaccharide deacetylase 2 family uncharacterized protein YibQ
VVLRTLLWFWVPVLVVVGAGAGVLQVLGPLPAPSAPRPAPVASAAAASVAATVPASAPAPHPSGPPATRPPAPGAAIAAPDSALLEPATDLPDASVPRIGADGRMPLRVYAAGYDASDARPRVALLLADLGMRQQDSEDAIRQTPAAVSLAVNPYAVHLEQLAELARQRGHELLISIPMEPEKYPLNDPGNEALLTSIAPGFNAQRLEWALSRVAGYVGATGALGALRGERFAASDQMKMVFDELKRRGLLYVDPRAQRAAPGAPADLPPYRAVDLVIDEPAVGVEIDAKLARLDDIALERGSAVGLVGRPSPVTTERILVWARNLQVRGLQLVPVSALVAGPTVQATAGHGSATP